MGASLDRARTDIIVRHIAEIERAFHDARDAFTTRTRVEPDIGRAEADSIRPAIGAGPVPPRIAGAQNDVVGNAGFERSRAGRAADLGRKDIGHSEKAGDKSRARRPINLGRRSLLLDAAAPHNDYAIRQRKRFFLVMRDIDGGEAETATQIAEFGAHRDPQLSVEVGKRLVKQDDLAVGRERARQRHPLLLSAGEAACRTIPQTHEVDELESALDRWSRLLPGDAARPKAEADIVIDGHVRPDRVGLEPHR
jgi:hypothetical protein